MNPTDLSGWISSKEVLAQSSISRATLNNYIKLGILPRPIVKNPGATLKGVKQIGYFPIEVLDRISKVKQLKRENQTIDEIAAHFQKIDPIQWKGRDTNDRRSTSCQGFTGEILARKGVISETQLKDILDEQNKLKHRQIGEILADIHDLDQQTIDRTISETRISGKIPLRARTGEILVAAGLLTQEQVEDALAIQEIGKKKKIGALLIEKGLVTEDQLNLALPAQTCETMRNDSHLRLTIDQLNAPAYLINHRFEIEWINDAAQKNIFNQPVRSIEKQASRNIFKLFFRWPFHDHVQNWQQIIGLHLGIVKHNLPRTDIPSLFSDIGESEIHLLETLHDEASEVECKEICDLWGRFEFRDETTQVYHIYCLHFREGLFVVYVPAEESPSHVLDLLGQRRNIVADLLRKRIPSLESLSVLVADLQDSVRICAELPPAEYFEMINQLWESLTGCIEKYDGICGKHAGDGFVYYFLNRPNGRNHVLNAINCAREMRERIKAFSEKWRVRKGWLNDFYLNIGINEGQEFCGTIRCASFVEFTALGDTINYAARLSDFARYGSIWVTKNVINRLETEDLSSIRFGIQRQNGERTVFTENSFARVADMLAEHDRPSFKFADIATIPVTEVF